MSLHDRLFRGLLRLLPAEFRGDYGREMEAAFRAERRDAAGRLGTARLWAATIADVFRTAPAEHLDILARDLSYTLRMLARRPALTATAIITLALGIGANTAIFSVVNGVLFVPLSYPEADRLVLIQEHEEGADPGTTGYFSFDRMRSAQSTFDWVAAMGGWSATLNGEGRDAERVLGTRVSWEFFRTLGIQPQLGRDFERQDDHPERRRQVLLSDELWRRHYGGDPSIVGKPVIVNGIAYTVIGVMPRGLREIVSTRLYPKTEIWTLLGYSPELPQACRSCRHIQVVGRVKRHVNLRQAEADVARIYRGLETEFPQEYSKSTAVITPIRTFFLGPIEQPLMILWGAVALLLVITCANTANLLLMRASERDEEIAIRRALGVSPVRLLRQLVTESMVLAVGGGAIGALVARWGTTLIATHGPESIPRLADISVDPNVLLYALGISIATGVIFGMAPARMLIGRQNDWITRASDRAYRVTSGPGTWRYRAALIAVNVALSVVLLVGSGLLVRSFVRLTHVEPGFDPRGLLTLQINLSGRKYAERPAVTNFYQELLTRLRSIAGVEEAGAASQLPLTDSRDRWGVTIEGRPLANPAAAPEADRYAVTPGYFAAMRIPLIRGRLLTAADAAGSEPVIVIGQTMASELWPGENPIGRRVTLAGGPNNPPRTIVGVVGDVRHYGLHLAPTIQAYMPPPQAPWYESSFAIVIRAKPGIDPLSLAAAARGEVRALDPLQPVSRIRTYDAIVSESMSTRRFTLALTALFAATALVLAIVGLYGALSFVVAQRRREIGVRVALGAREREIRRLVVTQGMRPALLGLAAGLGVTFVAARLIESLLYGITTRDAATFVAVVAVMTLSALLACLIPAVRAAQIDPALTLRAE